jgi:two-component system sensor histidine kinase AlgZ
MIAMQIGRRPLAISLALMVAVGGAAGLLMALSQGATSVVPIARTIGISVIYSAMIGLPAWMVMDRLFHRLASRSALVRGGLAVAALAVLSGVGCAVAGLLFIAIGWMPADEYWDSYLFSVRVALLIGAIITVSATFWEGLRQRLDESRLAEARAKELAAEARLHALEARVHPHFLFNTLNSVLSLIPADPARAEELLEKLASLLRFSLDAGRAGLIPLADELRIVRDYLDIESARLAGRLATSIEVEGEGEGELDGWLVPPFSLQTLVENSVRHAIASRRKGGQIRIRARGSGERLELSVWDDGAGFSRTELRPGHGIDNLESRLAVLFGERAGLALERRDGGMAVTVTVPRPDPAGARLAQGPS